MADHVRKAAFGEACYCAGTKVVLWPGLRPGSPAVHRHFAMSRSVSADPTSTQKSVAWSSWLWHLLNTQRVPIRSWARSFF
ncbi:hypothetical protein KL934_003678 [Ogataea polymorpha]|nr:hypothetical protein KL934_003678 [Ogataea polymorpha]